MACEDHAVPSRTESSAVGNTQRRNGGTRKGHHNPRADASLCRLENSQTRYTKSLQLGRRSTTQFTNFRNNVVLARKCPGLNIISCCLGYTSRTGPPFSGWAICSTTPACRCRAKHPASSSDLCVIVHVGNKGFDLCRDSPPREGGVGLGSGDLLYRAAADHTVCDSVVSNEI